MRTTERFSSLQEVRAEKERLRTIRDHHQRGLAGQWDLLRDPDFRLGLARNAVSDVVGSWKPTQLLGDLLGVKRSDSHPPERGRSLKEELISGLARTIIPILIQHVMTPERVAGLERGLNASWQWIQESLNNARSTRSNDA